MRPQQPSPARRHWSWQLLAPFALLLVLAIAAAGRPASAGAGLPANIRGDVNCTRAVDSVDAALVLQFTAALIETFACPEAADVDGNASVNSIDANLILQLNGGLQDSLLRMSLAITAPAVPCADPPTTCAVPAGSAFRLAVVLDSAPPEGYIAIQTYVFYGGLAYNRAAMPADEIVWPASALPVWFPPEPNILGFVVHGSLSTVAQPFPVSNHAGRLVEFELSCPPEPGRFKLSLLAYEPLLDVDEPGNPLGAAISLPDQTTVSPIKTGRSDLDLNLDGMIDREEQDLAVAATLEVRCV
ncbi:MAG: dockerin type I repeat-containing protein [Chloroflexi bacterium]|nr:dockerin type I repeat-containing protein [Chloroflexota bacterium]